MKDQHRIKNKDKPNKSMDVMAKQRLSYQTGLVVLELCAGGFAPRHLNRSTAAPVLKETDKNVVATIRLQ